VDNIGQRLREERQLRGWSQRDLARETGVNTDTISGVETGQHEPRPSTLRKLAEGLGIEVRDLFAEPVLPKVEAPRGAGLSLLEKALNAARPDEERAIVLPPGSYVIDHEEDRFRAELRSRGFPDEYFDSFIWPLVIKAVRADGLEEENSRLEEENAVLRKRAARVE
jgi:transcriptional regulator with XRE-family HTH domain